MGSLVTSSGCSNGVHIGLCTANQTSVSTESNQVYLKRFRVASVLR